MNTAIRITYALFYAGNVEYKQDKLRVYGNIFNQSDSRTSTGGQNLGDDQKRILSQAGDDAARVSSIDTLAFTPTRVLYKLEEVAIPCKKAFTILVYSTNPDSAQYTARFSFVGAGLGNYILDNTQIANERVYRFISPDPITCQPRGDYEPVIQLLAPRQQRLITLGGEYQIGKNAGLQTEIAISNNDQNRFSNLDSGDDTGIAAIPASKKVSNWTAFGAWIPILGTNLCNKNSSL
ncbi:MAG: hypothetical protein IPJ74_04065 [Saprospiraceae bacterium]|nr:hypothetical protein [Saprospiraceae bacterium]